MTGDRSLFTTYYPCNGYQTVRIANGTRTKVEWAGTIHLSETLTLYSVLFVPDLNCNLISVSKLNSDLHCETKFFAKYCVFWDLNSGRMIVNAELRASLYLFDVNTSSVPVSLANKNRINPQCWLVHSLKSVSKPNKDSAIMTWHCRLGHSNFLYLKRLFPSLFINKNPNLFHCEVCQLAKHIRKTYSPRPYKPSHHFSLIHGDIWGPTRIPNITVLDGFLLLVDDHTRLCWTFLMKEKSETNHIFRHFHAMVQNQFKTNIQILKTDNARDFFNSNLGPYLKSHGIVQQSSCIDTPQQNGIVERKNRNILEVARTMLFQ